MALAGCSGEPIVTDPVVGEICSSSVKESAKPDGQPHGSFDHELRNKLGVQAEVVVAHMHASGCALGIHRADLADGESLTLDYEPHLWDASERVVYWGEKTDSLEVDWACTWVGDLRSDGVHEDEDEVLCA